MRAWKHPVMLTGAVWLLILSVAVVFGSQEQRPVAVVPEPSHTFSRVPEGAEVRHDFVIYNHGTKALEISRVDTG